MSDRSKILSIQSQVAYGYVGNSVAKLAIELNGVDAITIPTIILSSHTDYAEVYGQKVSTDLFSDLIKGITAIKVVDDVNYIITGYYGSTDLIDLSEKYIGRLKDAKKRIYVCDPVMGDNGALYVPEEVAASIIHKLIPLSDIIVPNAFEMEYILKTSFTTPDELLKLIANHSVLKEKVVIVTNASFEDTKENTTETVIVKEGLIKRICTEYVPARFVGTGDLFTSLFTSMIATGSNVDDAVNKTATCISDVLKHLKENNCTELNAEAILRFCCLLK